jgi:hypothetical protein
VTFNANASAINVEIPPQSVPFSIAQLGGFMSGTVYASASAHTVPWPPPCALCVLGPSGLTLDDTGSGSFTVTDSGTTPNAAGIVVDSTASPAAYINGSGSITAPSIGVVGGYGLKNSGTFSPTPTTGVNPVTDPLGYLSPPTPGNDGDIPSTTYSSTTAPAGTVLQTNAFGSVSLGGNADVAIPPGNYSSISVIGGANLILEPGTYFIAGPLSVSGTSGASVTESGGVLLYFTCSSGGMLTACASGGQSGGSLSLAGTGDVNLAPEATGPYAGLTVFYDRNNDAGITLSGTPTGSFSGTVYAKDSALSMNGTGQTMSSMIIVNSATISGNGTIGVNYNASQNITPPGIPYLCSNTANNC